MPILSPTSISLAEFNETLNRYPQLIKNIAKASTTSNLEELDRFRFVDAPARFSKKGGSRPLGIEDVQKLFEWKLRHGTYHPGASKKLSSNSDDAVKKATSDAFSQYFKNEKDLEPVLKAISTLKGIGPATSSLILACHDPDHVIFFSDEVYKWLIGDGNTPKYNIKEFDELFGKAKALIGRLRVTPIQIEKVAFVIIKESEPPKVKAVPKVPSGLPRGRPKKPDSEKKVKAPSGRGRGRPPSGNPKPAKAAAGKRGRPGKAAVNGDDTMTPVKKRKATAEEETPGTGRSKRSKA